MKTATKVKELDGFTGVAALYRLSEPVGYGYDPRKETDHVIVSATSAMYSGPETYIFPANAEGEILNWCELGGSYRGGFDHEEALSGLGFAVASECTNQGDSK